MKSAEIEVGVSKSAKRVSKSAKSFVLRVSALHFLKIFLKFANLMAGKQGDKETERQEAKLTITQ